MKHVIRFRFWALVLIAAIVSMDTSCTVRRVKKLDPSVVPRPDLEQIVGVTTKAGEEISFDPPGGHIKQKPLLPYAPYRRSR